MNHSVDAVIIGGGHHGLVSAATLADAGWDVVVLEARDRVGGAVASRVDDGWVSDEYSAIHPLAAVSPVFERLDLAAHGLRWARSSTQLAHLVDAETPAAVVLSDAEDTAALLDADHPGDGDAWVSLVHQWRQIKTPLLASLMTAWPPVLDPIKLVRTLGVGNFGEFARFLLLPVHRMGEELFAGQAGRNLLAGNALHADIPVDAPGSGLFGWMMAMLAQDVGMPAPVGGAQRLAEALLSRAEAGGAAVFTNSPVTGIEVSGGRARAVVTADGQRFVARRAIIADTSAQALYQQLLPASALSTTFLRRLDRFAWDLPTVKINLRLAQPIPWCDPAAHGAAVLHLGHDVRGGLRWSGAIESGTTPKRPFALAGQMTSVDPTRSPAGTETFWAYAHLARGPYQPDAARETVAGLDALLEELAPGVHELVVGRYDQTPDSMEADDANLHWGAVGGGTMQLFQQAIFRPTPGLGGPRTPIERLYLGSAAIHPGGGVHGGCGHLAAKAALVDARVPGVGRLATSLTRKMSG